MDMKLLIATPCYGGMATTEYLESMLRLAKMDVAFDLMLIANESLIPRARNSCVAAFLGNESYTHLLFIDADIGFMPHELGRLLSLDKPVVAGVYPKKKRNWEKGAKMGYNTADELQYGTLDYVLNVCEEGETLDGETFDGAVTDGFMRVAYAGTGFMLIQRQVFTKLMDRFPEDQFLDEGEGYDRESMKSRFWNFFAPMIHPQSKRYLSEDFGFCYKWRVCGGEIWVNCMSELTHVGRSVYHGDVSRIRKEAAE
ncbi:hypothetical protein GCM10017044_15670 [Kordiimonas sediminis]|uniref:Uncharacterized protein n=1 Tax=Kordiimonas sediminis TaxID=1735581 RepID=A0A919E7M6_9PROT|nr:hypothetical protein [Kordiimonas sediminis]GHF22371.1 hypothetical protein GCM10017044_15670 [Kordiimonas sediminis]